MIQAVSGKGVAALVMSIMIGVLAGQPAAATERQAASAQVFQIQISQSQLAPVQTASEISVGQGSAKNDLKRLPTTDDRAARHDRSNLIEALTVAAVAVGGVVLGTIGGGLGLGIAAGVAGVYLVLLMP